MTHASTTAPSTSLGALRQVPYMGVIHVVAEAVKLGFTNGDPDWCNLGQGQPEVGEMAGAPPRITKVEMSPEDAAYGPLEGTPELREAVAATYNRLYRQGKDSQYTGANVSIASGGRLALTRAFAALGDVRVGYPTPDYTAYQDMFETHLSRLEPIVLPSSPEDGWRLSPATIAAAADSEKLSAFLFSNPCNPTGAVVSGDELAAYAEVARTRNLTFLADEFYSHFIYSPTDGEDYEPGAGPVSLAAHIEDVERDPIVIFDGLTKSYRYPGWRIGWVIGPSAMVETMARTASAIDGGPSRIAQRAALEVLEPARADQETTALRQVFCTKRNLMIRRLKAMGIRFANESESTFYCWGSIADLPQPFDDAETFFRRALDRKVMTVPGAFFDVNPGNRRPAPSPLRQWMRFSFGPPIDNLTLGLDRLEALLRER